MKLKLTLTALAASSLAASAATIANYDSGVSPTAGATGAADPFTQGWSGNGDGGGFTSAEDSLNGGWRITDGSTRGSVPQYDQAITATQATDMTTNGWTLSYTATMNGDAIGDDSTTVSNNYYLADSTRQNNNLMLVEFGGRSWDLGFTSNASNQIIVAGNIVGGGVTMSNELNGAGNPETTNFNLDYVDFTLSVAPGATSGTLTTDQGDSFTINSTASGGNRIYWGSGSGAGQGSTTWNNINLSSVPEPSSTALLGLGGLALILRRRK